MSQQRLGVELHHDGSLQTPLDFDGAHPFGRLQNRFALFLQNGPEPYGIIDTGDADDENGDRRGVEA